VFYTSVVLILPLVIVLTLNVLLIRALQESKRRLRLSSLERYDGRSETNITIVMVAIVIELVLCHTPDRVLQVSLSYIQDTEMTFTNLFLYFCHVFSRSYLSSIMIGYWHDTVVRQSVCLSVLYNTLWLAKVPM